MITIKDRQGRPFQCYADKPLVRPVISWATISPELKRFYADMADKTRKENERQQEQLQQAVSAKARSRVS